MSLESAQRMYDAQEPCEKCGKPCNGKYCRNCAKNKYDEEEEYEIDERR